MRLKAPADSCTPIKNTYKLTNRSTDSHQLLVRKRQQISAILHCTYNLYTGFAQTLKCFFQDLQRPNSRVFQDSKILFFQGFPGHVTFTNMIAWGQKVYIQNQSSVYLHYSKQAEMQYLRLYYCIEQYKGISNTWLDPRGGNVLKGIVYLLSDYSNQN